jgi:malate/lactate dehydrogenase
MLVNLQNVVTTGDAKVAFTGADAVIMLGAFPRKVCMRSRPFFFCEIDKASQDGMERKDLLEKNCGIFKEQVGLSYITPIPSELVFFFEDPIRIGFNFFLRQGELLNTVASKTVKVNAASSIYPGVVRSLTSSSLQVLVVGNPANTNCLIASKCAPNIPKGKIEVDVGDE